ncbi:hypothetical protein [Streptomyces sp. NPDC047725]|uniref:hypothetical protein n=1 Tax=Streptomyces sp. NPDC047725 TaxID=3365487 RepID=UPI003718DEE0
MNHSGKVDQDDIVRARNVLLASGRRTPREEVDAYRVLAQVSPASYLPLLSRALRRLSYDTGSGERHPACLALREEAVAVARSIDPAEPTRARVLHEALDSCQRELYDLGRRAEGLALRAEMLAVGRAGAALSGTSAAAGLHAWATGLSEEGRCAETADAMTELVSAILPGGPDSVGLSWSLLEWIAMLQDAGRPDEALAAFETLVGVQAADAANDRGPAAGHLYSLVGYALMLDTHGRRGRAALVRQQALALLTRMAETGERNLWSGSQASVWAVVLSFSGADGDRATPDAPRPPSGTAPLHWSPDAKRRYFDSRHALRAEVDALARRADQDPDQYLAELVRLHRVLTVRSAVYWEHRTHLFAERVRPLFDDGVDLARRLSRHDPADGTRTLACTLIERSGFHTAAGDFGPALDDFREALGCLGEAG